MQKYKTTAIVELFGGKIGLTEKQAAKRPDKLKRTGNGVYEILYPVQFKAGEVIALDSPDKITLSKLELVESQAKAQKGK